MANSIQQTYPWTDNNIAHIYLRQSDYNNSVCMTKASLDIMTANFDSIFDVFSNFTDSISSLRLYPVNIYPVVREGGNILHTAKKKVEGCKAYYIDGKNYYRTLGQYFVRPYYNNYADYKGYTEIKVYLPFLGFVDLDINQCMGKWLQFRLAIDFFSGKGMYIVGVSDEKMTLPNTPFVDRYDDYGMRTLCTYECDIGIEIPLGSSNIGDIKRNLALGAVKTAANLGYSIYKKSLPAPSTTSTETTTYDIYGKSMAKGSRGKKVKWGSETTEKTTVNHRPVDNVKPYADVVNSSIEVLDNLHNTGSGGDRINDAGLLWFNNTFVRVLMYRPKFADNENTYAHYYGLPLGKVIDLNSITGYTEIASVRISGMDFKEATNKEIALLEEAFSKGIIL